MDLEDCMDVYICIYMYTYHNNKEEIMNLGGEETGGIGEGRKG